jgi:hypothetical protein
MNHGQKVRAERQPARMPVLISKRVAAPLFVLLLLVPGWAWAQYTLYGLGTLGGLATRPAAINDNGAVAGTLTGT